MIDTIAMIFGFTFVSIIGLCIIGSLFQFILQNIDITGKRNKKLLNNMDKMEDKKWKY